ncbi:MAG: hypothetical protein HKN32_06380, partial [Flavobacteriales bacterium]|nr:hypothetical protein [Flavobacteriales bacterium]
NFLGGQIAALTGAEGHSEEEGEKAAFNMDTTVREAIEQMGGTIAFDSWPTLSDDTPKNITVQKYAEVKDWVEFRQAYGEDLPAATWNSARSIKNDITSPDIWMNQSEWEDLRGAYMALLEADKKAGESEDTEPGIDEDEWKYFKQEFDPSGGSLREAYAAHKLLRLEIGLNKYVDVFSIIGYVLIGFAVLIALLSKPLNKLMHGVE